MVSVLRFFNELRTWSVIDTSSVNGTATNDNAAAGFIGEYVTATGTNSPGSGTPSNVASISLTAGDWDVQGSIQTNTGGSITGGDAYLSTTSAAVDPGFPNNGAYLTLNVPINTNVRAPIGVARFSLAATTTIYLVSNISYTVSNTNTGFIWARRAR